MSITLYRVTNLLDFSIKFLYKMHEMQHKVIILHDDEEFLCKLDEVLWTFKQMAFIPHVRSGHHLDKETPIVLQKPPFINVNQADMAIVLNSHDNIACDKVVKVFDTQAAYDLEKKSHTADNVICWIQQNDTWEKDHAA